MGFLCDWSSWGGLCGFLGGVVGGSLVLFWGFCFYLGLFWVWFGFLGFPFLFYFCFLVLGFWFSVVLIALQAACGVLPHPCYLFMKCIFSSG